MKRQVFCFIPTTVMCEAGHKRSFTDDSLPAVALPLNVNQAPELCRNEKKI